QATLGNLVNLANLRATRGDFAGARKFYEEALSKLPAGAARTRADLGTMLGQLEGRLGHLDQAEALFKDALHHAEVSGYQAASARLSMNLAAIHHARGDLIAALDGYRRAVGLLDQHASPSDRVMGHLVVADIALARDLVGLAEAALAEAQKRLDAMRGEDEGALREALDVDAMAARVAFARRPDPENRALMENTIERFMEAGRVADALGHQLALYDEDQGDGTLAARLPRIRESLAWAKKQNIDPLVLELTSLEALATNSSPETLAPLTTRARELGLKLVVLRLERRRAALLLHHGDRDAAQTLIAELIATAKTLGADAEVQRLQRLALR
ncbi:MAG TPA: tetratricopeptide repeat protein, partial [Myxococcota bacterium]|nr:tetratricopeptide repeat protein [Myxococcota bacterium]